MSRPRPVPCAGKRIAAPEPAGPPGCAVPPFVPPPGGGEGLQGGHSSHRFECKKVKGLRKLMAQIRLLMSKKPGPRKGLGEASACALIGESGLVFWNGAKWPAAPACGDSTSRSRDHKAGPGSRSSLRVRADLLRQGPSIQHRAWPSTGFTNSEAAVWAGEDGVGAESPFSSNTAVPTLF